MSRRGNEIEIAANPLLRWMEIAEIVSAVDDPKLFIASGSIQNFLVHRQHDECRKTNLRVNRNNVGLGIFDGLSAGVRVDRLRPGQHRGTREEKRGKHYESGDSREHRFLLTKKCFFFSNRSIEYPAGVFLPPLGSERRDSSPRGRWRGRPPRAGR